MLSAVLSFFHRTPTAKDKERSVLSSLSALCILYSTVFQCCVQASAFPFAMFPMGNCIVLYETLCEKMTNLSYYSTL